VFQITAIQVAIAAGTAVGNLHLMPMLLLLDVFE